VEENLEHAYALTVHKAQGSDFDHGGLTYQIQHHLFPSVPRNKSTPRTPHRSDVL
jgi:fatty acid desaturase